MKFKYLFSAAAFSCLSFFSFSQEIEPCSTGALTKMLWDENPEMEARYYEYEEQINALINQSIQRGGDDDDILPDDKVVTLPIVFHVLHEYGKENISEEQIYSQLRILNEDYRFVNTDQDEIVPAFQGIAGDAHIEFAMATIDPLGNPTNGIVRHFSNETNIGDGFSKLSQWPRSRYINVWIVRTINSGAAGFSHYPTSVEGDGRYQDGVVILNTYLGDTGTSSPYTARALTHEIGHYLNLAHLWGSTNDPGVACGDDGVDDTPITTGWNNCNDVYGATCNNEIDNIQNYMEYAYCQRMFTDGQIKRMRNALRLDVSNRVNLWQDENLAISIPEGMEYDPDADFYVDYVTNKDRLVALVGDDVKFRNWTDKLSGNNNETYTWTFEDGSVATSNDVNPTVSFTSPGWKTVSLKVEDNGRENTVTKENFIWISPNWPVFSGNIQFDFNDNPDYWIVQNPAHVVYEWQVKPDAGVNGSGGIYLNTSDPYTNPTLFSNEYFHNERRGGVKSAFVSQPMDLSYYTGSATVSFDIACATDATKSEDIKEQLEVFTSVDGGKTWQLRKKVTGTQLVNNGSGWDSFYPGNTTIWSNISFEIPNSNLNSKTFLRFVYTGSDKSNNIAIDNIEVQGTLGTDALQKESKLTVYPNPSDAAQGWNINYDASEWGGASVQLTDVSGRLVSESVLPVNQSEFNIKPGSNASQGVYFLRISNKERVSQSKLILN